MWTSVHAAFRSLLHPRPAGGSALVAVPLFPIEPARRRRHLKVAFRARHLSGAGVPRHFNPIRGPFAIRAIGPRTRELTVLVTMLLADFHSGHATYFHGSRSWRGEKIGRSDA